MSTSSSKNLGRPVDTAKRQAIVEAAAASFFDVGFAATSIEKIAADAGVSKVTIYNHFGDKHALFTESVRQECQKMRGYFSLDPSIGGTIRERLQVIGEAMSDFLSRPEMVQFERRIAAETEAEPAIGRAFLEAGPWPMKAAFSDFLAHADSQGELAVPDPDLAAEQFVAMCKGMGDLERRFGEQISDTVSDARIQGAVEVFLRAYLPK